MFYPYTTPQILDDNYFILYGGHTGTSSAEQRTAAYHIVEQFIFWDYLETFPIPTTVTGSYTLEKFNRYLVLDNTYVTDVHLVQFYSSDERLYYTISGTANNFISILDRERGLLDIDYLQSNCGCSLTYPYSISVVYTAGLPSGISLSSKVLLALSTTADIMLGEIIGYGNDTPGAIGLSSFKNQGYSETRLPTIRTPFGTGGRPEFVTRLLSHLVRRRRVGL